MGALDHTDPADRVLTRMVGASGTSYNCPSADIVEKHIASNLARIEKILTEGRQPIAAAEALRVDNTLLRARRDWLAWTAIPAPDAPEREL